MRLIVNRKEQQRQKIAETSVEPEGGQFLPCPSYTWSAVTATTWRSAQGHVLNPAFPEGYSNAETDLHDLIDAD